MYKVEVNTYGDTSEDVFTGNAVSYSLLTEAKDAAADLFQRWTAVRHYRVVSEDGVVHYDSRG